jgi:ABC-type nickel/cobalt efflux system permease component RcnA
VAGLDSLPIVLLAAVLLGLRHAADPDHIAAMTTLVAGASRRGARAAGMLGLAWGLGHGTMLVAAGLPLLILGGQLPGWLQQGAEATGGLMIVALSLRVVRRSRSERLHLDEHEHADGLRHSHLHGHRHRASHEHAHPARTRRGAFAIGLLHGLAGSGAVTLLLLVAIDSRPVAVAGLALFAAGSTAAMVVASTGLGVTLVRVRRRRSFSRVEPALGCLTLLFGVVYAAEAARLLAPL